MREVPLLVLEVCHTLVVSCVSKQRLYFWSSCEDFFLFWVTPASLGKMSSIPSGRAPYVLSVSSGLSPLGPAPFSVKSPSYYPIVKTLYMYI